MSVIEAPAPVRASRRVVVRRVLRIVALVLLVFVVLVGLALAFVPNAAREALGFGTVALGPWVPRAGELAVGGALLAILALVVAHRLGEDPDQRYRPSRTWTTWALAIAVPLSLCGIWLTDNATSATVLTPASDAGCQVVVLEVAGTEDAPHRIGIVQPGSIAVEWVGTVRSTEFFRPFQTGSYTLTWDGQQASIEIDDDLPTGVVANVSADPILCDA